MIVMTRFAKSLLIIVGAMLLFTMLAMLHPPSRAYIDPWTGQLFGEGGVEKSLHTDGSKGPIAGVEGGVIMGKLGNATAKAELGRATWKLMHTMTLRYPEHPTQDQRDALSSYFHLTSRLYPCGECATEFQMLLKKYPPQTSSRLAASLWLCDRLKKPTFDCAHLDETYDCGCGGDDESTDKKKSLEAKKDDLTGADMVRGGR
ncbi:ERV/ALR sulfhydryl oxidase domain-containing protein [Coprinopsis sp. MPI-PUGE-AT-0042]|nr:ERV/ALR sulfhydryl oxidase domain-containing protein [Coprinopsis sp. MPI-PUGE-AT-0042]